MDDVYELLVRNKRHKESFSDELRRVLKRKRSIMEFAGAWKDIDEEEAEKMKKNVRKLRKDSTKELLRKFKEK